MDSDRVPRSSAQIGNDAYLHQNIAFNGAFTPVLAKHSKSSVHRLSFMGRMAVLCTLAVRMWGSKWSRSRLRGHSHLSGVFQSEVVVHGLAEFLLAAEIPLGCLNRCVSK